MKQLILMLSLFLVCLSAGPSEDKKCSKMLDQILRDYIHLAKRDGLESIGKGGGINHGQITLVDISFDTTEILDINEARTIIIQQALLLKSVILNNPKYLKCFQDQEAIEQYFKLTIFAAVPKNQEDNYFDVVTTYRGKVRYHKSDPAKKVYPYLSTYEESYQEALSTVQGHKPSSGP